LPKRWIVGRTIGWLGRYRRHSKDYERKTASSEAMIYAVMSHTMLRRLGRQDVVANDLNRGRLEACLERDVKRTGCVLYASVALTDHLHLILKTPVAEPLVSGRRANQDLSPRRDES
jgi:hypothetical protein